MAGMKYFSLLQKRLSDFKGTLVNTSIVGATVAVEEILNHAVYYCPCVELSELGSCNSTSNSASSDSRCTPHINRIYGTLFITAPAVVLFFLSMAATPSLWKICTGRLVRSSEEKATKEKLCLSMIAVFGRSFIAPAAWVCYALLDGKYYACLATPVPYHIDGVILKTCQDVAAKNIPTHSDAYRDNRSYSQMIGWIVLGASAFLGLIAFSMSRLFAPLTYYHAKYYNYYRMHEENEFDDEMNKIAQKRAEDNVKKFMDKHRKKKIWDRISKVYEFHRNKDDVALYSYLHEFILKEEEEVEDNIETEVTRV